MKMSNKMNGNVVLTNSHSVEMNDMKHIKTNGHLPLKVRAFIDFVLFFNFVLLSSEIDQLIFIRGNVTTSVYSNLILSIYL